LTRDTDLCPHFGTCGGCASQDVPYADQLKAKEDRVRRAVEPFAPGEFRPILPSPDLYHYRNKMEFAFGGLKDGPVLLGLRQKGKFDRVVDLSECRLLSPETGPLLAAVRAWAEREKLPTYHLKSHKGFLRYLVVREGKNTGQRMVHLVTAAPRGRPGMSDGTATGAFSVESFLAALRASGVRVDTVVWSVNAGLSDVAYGTDIQILSGPGFIGETLGGKPFRVSPTAFFQSNTRGAEVLYGLIQEGLGDGDAFLDFYCGSGAIGLFCAGKNQRLIGVESNPAAVADAQENARLRGRADAEFHALDAGEFSARAEWLELWSRPGTRVAMDPPRPGLGPAVKKLLLERPVERWAYVSCNPDALAADLSVLKAAYDVTSVQAVDLFPHTPHVETVVHLRRKRGG